MKDVGANRLNDCFVGIDLEWASSVPGNICEIGVVWFENGKEVSSYKSLVRPIHRAWGSWQYLNLPYRLEDVLEAPTFPEVWEELMPRLKGQMWVAHNAASAEAIYLGSALAYHGLAVPADSALYCSLSLSKRVWKEEVAHGLRRMSQKLNLPLNHHDPESDARACGHIVLHAMGASGVHSTMELRDLLRWRPTSIKRIVPTLPETVESGPTMVFGMALSPWESPVPFQGIQPGQRMVLSGLSEAEKHGIREQAKSLNVRPVSTLNAKTNFVVAGELMGPKKLERCRAFGIPILTKREWLEVWQKNAKS